MRRPLCFCCLIFVILIIGIVELFPYEYYFSDITSGEIVLIEGKVAKKELKNINGKITYIICLEQIKSLSDSFTDNSRDKQSNLEKLNKAEGILCYIEESYIPNIGSRVQIRGKISAFDTTDNPGEFNMPLYYKIKGIDLKMYDCNLIAYSEKYSFLKEKLFRLKMGLSDLLDTCFKERYAGIAKAVLFAMNSEISEETKALYQKNGMMHILCVSGLHISILGMGLYQILKKIRIPDIMNTGVCIIIMLTYGIMIGMETSVIRAILMFSMNLTAKLLKRTYDLLTAACIGIFLILLEQPLYIYHSGFLLSFLSVVSLGAFRPIFPKKICKIEFVNKRVDSFFSTLAVFIFTLPIYGRFYYEVSLSGLLLNVLILPFVSIVLVLVIGVCVLGSLFVPIGQQIAGVCELFLWAFETIFSFFDENGRTTYILGYINLFKSLVYYVGIVLLIYAAEKVRRSYLYLGMLILCTFLIVHFPKDLTISCLSVGQGDSAVIEYKDLVCLIDAGSSSEKEVSKYTVLPFLKYQGIREIDYLFLTHADNDHINAVEEILRQSNFGIKVNQIVVADEKYINEYGNIDRLANEYGIPICEMERGDSVTYGTLQLTCLAPGKTFLDELGESNNEASMVLYLEMKNFQMLFTGDVEGAGEELLTKELRNRNISGLSVLKVAHHGSKNSTSKEFINQVKPQISIISCGKNNRYGHPHKETIKRLEATGSKILRTDELGAIILTISPSGEVKKEGYRRSVGRGGK